MNFLPKRDVPVARRVGSAVFGRSCAWARANCASLAANRSSGGTSCGCFARFRAAWRAGELDDLTLTTNGSQLARYAAELADCGVRRVNVSLDTLDPAKFRAVTRVGRSRPSARRPRSRRSGRTRRQDQRRRAQGLQRRRGGLADRMGATGRGYDLTFIEVMPLGAIEKERFDQYLPLSELRASLQRRFTLAPSLYATGGPARYYEVQETGGRLGFITTAHPQFLRRLQPGAGDLHRHALHVPGSGRRRRPARAAARLGVGCAAGSGDIAPRSCVNRRGTTSSSSGAGSHASTARHMSVTGG